MTYQAKLIVLFAVPLAVMVSLAVMASGWYVLPLAATGLAAIMGGLWAVLRMNRRIRLLVTEGQDGAGQINSAVGQVSSASQSLAQGASEQAASLEETSSTAQEINAMAHQNAERSRTVVSLMEETDGNVNEATSILMQMVDSMIGINNSSDRISKIIKVIDEIAFQTNILALNAAVEAARAGEAGMGFAVVADEVRNLAQRCSQAAQDTSSLIEESISQTSEGTKKMDQVTMAIGTVGESAAKVKALVGEVNIGSEEQARAIEQISQAISQMEHVTQNTAASAEESAAAGQELNSLAESVHTALDQLQEMLN